MTAEIRRDVIVATEHIKAPPEVVFPYFTRPALARDVPGHCEKEAARAL